MTETMPWPDLRNKVVFITGAANGIGRAMALAFAKQGARLVLIDINDTALVQLKTEIGKSVETLTYCASVIEPLQIQAAVELTVKTFGTVDVMICNAGISMNKPSLDVTPQEWQKTIDINLNGVFYCAQAAARQMLKQGSGSIIAMASMYGVVAAADRVAYCASKAGVVGMVKSLAVEWAPQGVRVNALCPGYVQTDLVTDLMQRGILNRAELEQRIPMKKLAQPEQIAQMALFMASETSNYMTGHALVADGGWSVDSFKKLT